MVVVHPSVRHGCTVAKRCKIGPRLLLIIDNKSQILAFKWHENRRFWMILKATDNLRSVILATAGLLVFLSKQTFSPRILSSTSSKACCSTSAWLGLATPVSSPRAADGQSNMCSSSQLHSPFSIIFSIHAFCISAVSSISSWHPSSPETT